MLSRVADSVYWMSRGLERAENVARFIDVNLNLMLDSEVLEGTQWRPLITTSGDLSLFEAGYEEATKDSVIRFLTVYRNNPNSIISCAWSARENARSIREIISSEMWEQANRFYHLVRDAQESDVLLKNPHAFFTAVKMESHLSTGSQEPPSPGGSPGIFSGLERCSSAPTRPPESWM